mgnify:FL=1|jgi:hypothetical protein
MAINTTGRIRKRIKNISKHPNNPKSVGKKNVKKTEPKVEVKKDDNVVKIKMG